MGSEDESRPASCAVEGRLMICSAEEIVGDR